MTDLLSLLVDKLESTHILLLLIIGIGLYLVVFLKSRKSEISQTDHLIQKLSDQITSLMERFITIREPDISGLELKIQGLENTCQVHRDLTTELEIGIRKLSDNLSGIVSDAKFFDNNHDAFKHLINQHELSKAYIKATRYSQKAIQDISEYWNVVRKKALDPSTVYKRLTSVRSKEALNSVCDMLIELKDAKDFQLALTSDIEFMEILVFDGKQAVQCFHKDDFIIYSALSLSHEVPVIGAELVNRFESMFDLMWANAEIVIDVQRQIDGSREKAELVINKVTNFFNPIIQRINSEEANKVLLQLPAS